MTHYIKRQIVKEHKQARLEELGGILGAILAGVAVALPFVLYIIH